MHSEGLSHVILFCGIDKAKIHLAGTNITISFSAEGEFSIISKAENDGIFGFFEFKNESKNSSINVFSEGVSKSVINVSQYINVFSRITIRFAQPNIEFNVDTFSGSNTQKVSIVVPELFTMLEGDSVLSIRNEMNNAIIDNDYKVHVPILEDISNQKVIDYYNRNHALVKMNKKDVSKIKVKSFTLIGTKPTIHGFIESNMELGANKSTGEISFYFKECPLRVPFNLCYEVNKETFSCDIALTEDNIDDFGGYLPPGALVLQAQFGAENTKYLNLSIPKIEGSTVIIKSQQAQIPLKMYPGNGITSLLSLNHVAGKIIDSNSFSVNRVEISNGATIGQITRFTVINIDYDTIWKFRDIPSCSNEIIINLTSFIINLY